MPPHYMYIITPHPTMYIIVSYRTYLLARVPISHITIVYIQNDLLQSTIYFFLPFLEHCMLCKKHTSMDRASMYKFGDTITIPHSIPQTTFCNTVYQH